MVKKLSTMESMKPVVAALRDGKKPWSELSKVKAKNKTIPEKTLDRRLKDLEYLGLAKKEGDYWVWYEHLRIFNSQFDYDLAIKHSRELIPAIRSMLSIKETERTELYFAAKEHLRSYPETCAKLEKFEKFFDGRVRELLRKHGSKIRTPDTFMLLDPVKVKGKGLLGGLFSTTEFKRRKVPYMLDFGDHPEIKDINELKKTEEYKELMELREFLDDTKKFNERFEVYGELARDLAVLSLRIEMGEPLEGKCSLCPNIKIKEN